MCVPHFMRDGDLCLSSPLHDWTRPLWMPNTSCFLVTFMHCFHFMPGIYLTCGWVASCVYLTFMKEPHFMYRLHFNECLSLHARSPPLWRLDTSWINLTAVVNAHFMSLPNLRGGSILHVGPALWWYFDTSCVEHTSMIFVYFMFLTYLDEF
jgi:hypothetical protein